MKRGLPFLGNLFVFLLSEVVKRLLRPFSSKVSVDSKMRFKFLGIEVERVGWAKLHRCAPRLPELLKLFVPASGEKKDKAVDDVS